MSPSLCKRVQGNHLERVTFTIKKKKKILRNISLFSEIP